MPAHNEEVVISETVHHVMNTVEKWLSDFEIIVVDDGSKDRTGAILDDSGTLLSFTGKI